MKNYTVDSTGDRQMKNYTVYTREGYYYAEYTRLDDAQIAAKRIGGYWQRTG